MIPARAPPRRICKGLTRLHTPSPSCRHLPVEEPESSQQPRRRVSLLELDRAPERIERRLDEPALRQEAGPPQVRPLEALGGKDLGLGVAFERGVLVAVCFVGDAQCSAMHGLAGGRADGISSSGVSMAIPAWRCSVLYQGKNDRQKSVAAAMSGKRPGKPGWYFRVLNWASENGLSSETWGRLSEHVTPRSASSCAVHLLVIGALRSECSVSTRGSTSRLRQVSSISRPASAEFSRSATIQPTA